MAVLPSALEVAEALFQQVFCYFGVPEDIISDCGPQFTSRVWFTFMEKLGVSVNLTSGYHPQLNGQVERMNQEIGRYLRSYCSNNQVDWARFIPWVEYAQNSLIHSVTKLAPFQCVIGYKPPRFPWNLPEFHRSAAIWENAYWRME